MDPTPEQSRRGQSFRPPIVGRKQCGMLWLSLLRVNRDFWPRLCGYLAVKSLSLRDIAVSKNQGWRTRHAVLGRDACALSKSRRHATLRQVCATRDSLSCPPPSP